MISFEYQNPTRIIFGQGAVEKLSGEILKHGRNVLLIYGGNSLKESGTYGRITAQLAKNQIAWAELPVVLFNAISMAGFTGNDLKLVAGIYGVFTVILALGFLMYPFFGAYGRFAPFSA